MTEGDNAAEMLVMLEDAKKAWIEVALDRKITIPEPTSDEFSGKFNIRVPKFLHRKLVYKAREENVSLNRIILSGAGSEKFRQDLFTKEIGVWTNPLKKIILKDLYDTMILKDIAKTFLIENINSLEEFSRYLSLIIGGVISYENISKEINLSFQTIKKYLDAMEKSYLISRAKPFHTNKIKEITKQPKIYFIDTGLRNIIAKNFDVTPSGQLFENYVYSELLKFGFEPKYWRTKSGAEVDFVVDVDGQIIPIEVKAKADNKVSKSLRSFIDNYNPKRAFVVSYKNKQGKININNCEVMFLDILSLKKQLKKD